MYKIEIKQKIKFYNWGVKKGINMANLEVEKLNFAIPEEVSSFKNRASEIKNKFNHKFNFKCEHGFKGLETLERFTQELLTAKKQ